MGTAILAAALALSGCAPQGDPLAALLDREQSSQDEVSTRILDNTMLLPDSVRYAGTDTHDYTYFVGTSKEEERVSQLCLLVVAPEDQGGAWHGSCGGDIDDDAAQTILTARIGESLEIVLTRDASTSGYDGERVGGVVVITKDTR